jgi:acyl-CoA thioester hydrolase
MSEPSRSGFHATRRVEFRDTDAAGIAHFSAFLFYMESVEHEWLRQQGLSVMPGGSVSAGEVASPISWPRVSVGCDFSSSVRFEDVLDVRMRVARLGTKSVTYEFEFTCGGRPVAKGRTVAVCCRISAGNEPQGIPIPEPLAEKLRSLIE